MPRKPCYWTRKLELELVEFVRKRDFIWKPIGNTNHHIQQKYKAYAEFAAKLGRGFTVPYSPATASHNEAAPNLLKIMQYPCIAFVERIFSVMGTYGLMKEIVCRNNARAVRDRWVNIRSTFNHNVRRVDKSKETARTPADVYVPCWPLWKPLQFLKCTPSTVEGYDVFSLPADFKDLQNLQVKEESASDIEINLSIRQRGQRTDRPRRKGNLTKVTKNKCKRVIDDLVRAMKPLLNSPESSSQSYWFFGKHVTERLNCMREIDAVCAVRDIMTVLDTPASDDGVT